MLIEKLVLKMWLIINKRHFVISLGNSTHKSKKLQKKTDSEASAKWKVKENQTRLFSWYWKWKPTLRKDLITYDSHLWIMFFLIDWLSFREGELFEAGRPRSSGWKDFEHRWTWGVGGLWKLNNFDGRHMCIIP